ncbi:hypothetical protein PybrP1_004601 [[Pythium] brassicae (nom. inval.)]|nr:hypothetical protein PybrP1_004601 [[Pythium] brassicae (nom. inval.)]
MAFDGAAAVLLAAKFCRASPLLGWREEALPALGRRAQDKFCFRVDLLNLRAEGGEQLLLALFPAHLSFLDFGRESLPYKLKALLVTLRHPYILPVVDFHYSREKKGLLVLQPFAARGSLKDRIHRADPTRAYADKYRAEAAAPLSLREIARFGRQVLEALAALRARGIMCEHLSSGNVVVDDAGNARIADIYAPLLAVDRPRASRELTVPLEAKVALDLLLFGHVLYEMATGLALATPQPEARVLELLAPEVADVLELIFFPAYISRAPSAGGSSESNSSSNSVKLAENEGEEDEEDEGEDDEEEKGERAGEDDTESLASVVAVAASSSSSGTRGGRQSRRFVVTLDAVLSCALFAGADVPPIATLFAGFRLDSSMKSTVKASMRINASRNEAYVVHFKEQEALQRARQRAERRVHDEREKQEQRIQRLAAARNQPAKDLSFNSKTTPGRRRSYRAESLRAGLPHRQLHRTSSSANPTSLAESESERQEQRQDGVSAQPRCARRGARRPGDRRDAQPARHREAHQAAGGRALLRDVEQGEVEDFEAWSKAGHHKLASFVLVSLDQNVGETLAFLDETNPKTGRPRVCRDFRHADDEPTVLHFGCADVPEPYAVSRVPHKVFIDASGVVRRNADDFHWDDIAGLLRHRLEEKAAKEADRGISAFLFPSLVR